MQHKVSVCASTNDLLIMPYLCIINYLPIKTNSKKS